VVEGDYIEFTKLVIPNDAVCQMTRPQKRQYLMITNMLRDLSLLQKLLLFVGNNDRPDEPSESANTTISFFFLKTLISKNYEMWEFMEKEGLRSEGLGESLDNMRREIIDFFEEESHQDIFSFIRNKFGFHYESDPKFRGELEDLIEPAMNNHEMDMWLSGEDSGNDIFGSSNAVMIKVIFQRMKDSGLSGDDKALMDQLFELTLKISSIFREFCLEYMLAVVLKDIKLHDRGTKKVRAPLLSRTKLPLIVKCDRPGIPKASDKNV